MVVSKGLRFGAPRLVRIDEYHGKATRGPALLTSTGAVTWNRIESLILAAVEPACLVKINWRRHCQSQQRGRPSVPGGKSMRPSGPKPSAKNSASGLRSEICRGATGGAIAGKPGRPPARSIGRIIILKQTPISYASSRGTTIYGSLSRRDSLGRLPPKRKTDLRCKWLTGRCPWRQRLTQKGLCEALRIVIAARWSMGRCRHLRG